LRDQLRQHQDLLRFALSEMRHHPELKDDLRRCCTTGGV
jgi:hypothetical protein